MKHSDKCTYSVILFFSKIIILQLWFPFCGAGSGAMASSSTLPCSGNAMVSLSRVRACIFWQLFVGKCTHSFGRGILHWSVEEKCVEDVLCVDVVAICRSWSHGKFFDFARLRQGDMVSLSRVHGCICWKLFVGNGFESFHRGLALICRWKNVWLMFYA